MLLPLGVQADKWKHMLRTHSPTWYIMKAAQGLGCHDLTWGSQISAFSIVGESSCGSLDLLLHNQVE